MSLSESSTRDSNPDRRPRQHHHHHQQQRQQQQQQQQQLRHRSRAQTRSRILKDKQEDTRVQRIIAGSIVKNQHYSNHLIKTVIVVVTAVLCTFGAVLHRTRPRLFQRFFAKLPPPIHLATTYPSGVVLERDLPRFFRQYSIATPDNVHAQEAVRRVLRSRTRLRQRAGSIHNRATVKAWDESNVGHLLKQGICGDDFARAHANLGASAGASDPAQAQATASKTARDDLLMWCILASRIAEGFFAESVEMLDSALSLIRNRGIVVRKQKHSPEDGHGGALSTSFYLHPRNNDDYDASVNWIPMKVLATLIDGSKDDGGIGDGVEELHELAERTLYELVVTQGHEKDFLILDEVCQENRPERSIAIDTRDRPGGCYFVVPEKYGGSFEPLEND
eukprot:jgi/Psemu1/14334/gm1.14334_g